MCITEKDDDILLNNTLGQTLISLSETIAKTVDLLIARIMTVLKLLSVSPL